jgi:1,4-alpha-glucan branching enzyme
MRPDNTTTEISVMDTEPSLRPLDSLFSPSRHSAGRMTKPISFFHHSAHARAVFLTGDFNGWNPTSHPMSRQPDGGFTIQIPLPHGHHRYQFLVDGVSTFDPHALGTAQGPSGEKVSLMAVS